MSAARVLATLAGYALVVGGTVELGPQADTPVPGLGVALVAAGLLSWVLVWRRRRSGGRAVAVTAALLAVLTGLAVAVALVPPDLPASAAASGLSNAQSARTPGEPEPTGYLTASDGTKLAYFADIPADPVATLVFYHGSGANAGAGYLDFGRQLAARYGIATYLFDMRGHGRSGGRRGDAPSPRRMFADTQAAVAFVKRAHPALPEFAGGHSAGAGLVLNSEDRIARDLAGYVYLAPDFGLHSGTERRSGAANFVTLSHRVLIADVLSNGLLDAHTYAVSFAYTQEEIDRAGLVSRYTPAMALAQDAGDSATVLARTPQPVGVWIGADDEVFDAAKVTAWAAHAPLATTGVVAATDHLGIIDRSVDTVGPWLVSHATAG
ncbi:alpha/beta hydrolase [Dactylosporangium vinaceum]|uniref:Alpha/beta hydrolase n=1 Tax=Dactylosporangium vinaceum TaxID=53362 RepID=A0ABV5MIU5_9ACTN|nr:alpha/beta fold hydrolase [Dactylosporangium vinaceum]UAB93774.1 alpha/beta hydrolase [Dactylosporangium vinaceum]